MTKQELAIKTLETAELILNELGKYIYNNEYDSWELSNNSDNWQPLENATVRELIARFFPLGKNTFIMEVGGMKFEIRDYYDYNAHPVTIAQFTLPALLEMLFPGGIRAAIELVAQIQDTSTHEGRFAIECQVDNSEGTDSDELYITTPLDGYAIENEFNQRGIKASTMGLQALLGIESEPNNSYDNGFSLWHVAHYESDKWNAATKNNLKGLGIFFSNQSVACHIPIDEFFNSPYDYLPPINGRTDTTTTPTFKGILKGYRFND